MKDFMSYFSGVSAIAPAAARTTTTNGAWIDPTVLNGGNDGLCFLVHAGTITDGTHTFKLQDSIDGGTTPVDVASPYVQTPSGQSSNAFTSTTASGKILKFGYLGNPNVGTLANSATPTASGKVLVRIVCTVTGSPSTGGVYSSIAIEGYPANEPAV